MNFVGKGKRLDRIDITTVAQGMQCGEDELRAFMEVETAGSGFDNRGRPKMLFEPHVFYRNLTGDLREKAVSQGLAYKRWGMRRYPSNSYPILEKALAVDEEAALMSASWGLGQILGENHKIVNYSTVKSMILAFMEDEQHHLQAMADFIIANKIDDDLAEHRWSVVARVYNGPGYAKHGYHERLRKAYLKWSSVSDISDISPYRMAGVRFPSIERGDKGEFVIILQMCLNRLGASLAVDGDFGPKTHNSFMRYRPQLNSSEIVTPHLWAYFMES